MSWLRSRRSIMAIVAASAATIALAVWGIAAFIRMVEADAKRARAEWISAAFEESRGAARVTVMRDGGVIGLLAMDPESAEALTQLDLSMVDLRESDVTAAGRLKNVKPLHGYSCYGIDNLLTAMKGSPILEEVSFQLCDESQTTADILKSFPNLKRVRFIDYASRDVMKPFAKALPGVAIEFE
jgi:hypothetical protein